MDKIVEMITPLIASVGGVGGIIAIICTLVKVLGSTGVNAKIAKTKIDLDSTMQGGLHEIADTIANKINTDITVDISAKLDKAVAKSLEEQKLINKQLIDDMAVLRKANSEQIRIMADFKAINLAKREELIVYADKLANDVHMLDLEPKTMATITIARETSNASNIPDITHDVPAKPSRKGDKKRAII